MSFKILFLFVIFNFSICAASKAQDNSKNVTITVSGSGNTAEEAKQAALRSAIEQAYGSFISTKTEVFNDRVVADEMASVSSGNIQSYKMLNESQLPNGTWGVTLNALVSIDKLTSFAESKGMAVEIKGGIFALNIKQQLINEASEQKIVSELVEILHEALQVSFDYVLKAGEPKSKDGGSQNWEIPVTVSAIGNSNMDFSIDYLTKTLNAISLSENEVERYHTIEKPVYLVYIRQWQNHDGYKKPLYFYLRNINTLDILQMLAYQWNFYKTNFILKNGKETLTYNAPDHDHGGLKKIVGREEKKSYDFNIYAGTYEFVDSYGFSSNGDVAGEFIFKDNKTLTEISEMTGYSIKADGVSDKLPFKHGGFVVNEKNGHGLVVGLMSELQFKSAKKKCETLELNGYTDWRLPTEAEGQILKRKISKLNLVFWSSELKYTGGVMGKAFAFCNQPHTGTCQHLVSENNDFTSIAVRSF